MHRDGHLGAALLSFAPVGLTLAAVDAMGLAAPGAAAAVVLAMVPDYDMRMPLVEHRGITHTLLFVAVAGVAVGAATAALAVHAGVGIPTPVDVHGVGVASLGTYATLVATLALLSHLAADALTPMGVPLLWPLRRRRYSLGLVRADNVPANYALLVAGTLATVAWAHPVLVGW